MLALISIFNVLLLCSFIGHICPKTTHFTVLSPEHICLISKSGPITRCIHHSNRALIMHILLSLIQKDRRAGLEPSSAHALFAGMSRAAVRACKAAASRFCPDEYWFKNILIYIVNYLALRPKRHRGAPEGPLDVCWVAFCCDVISVWRYQHLSLLVQWPFLWDGFRLTLAVLAE